MSSNTEITRKRHPHGKAVTRVSRQPPLPGPACQNVLVAGRSRDRMDHALSSKPRLRLDRPVPAPPDESRHASAQAARPVVFVTLAKQCAECSSDAPCAPARPRAHPVPPCEPASRTSCGAIALHAGQAVARHLRVSFALRVRRRRSTFSGDVCSQPPLRRERRGYCAHRSSMSKFITELGTRSPYVHGYQTSRTNRRGTTT